MLSDGYDAAHHLVTQDQRVGGHAPIVVEHGEITVADTAALHGDFNLLVPKSAGRVFICLKGLFGGGGCEGVDGSAHGRSGGVQGWVVRFLLFAFKKETSVSGSARSR